MRENNPKEIRMCRAEAKDTAQVTALYQSVIGTPFCTWNEFYPGDIEIRGDLQAQTLYLWKSGDTLVGACSVVLERELDDLTLWQNRVQNAEPDRIAEIARVVVAPAWQGKGIAFRMVREIETVLYRQGVRTVHLLAAQKNIPALKTYQKAGYCVRGEVQMYGNSYFACEKQILPLPGHRCLVIGCPGSGKTTFARALREKTSLPLYYLDSIWHKADRTTVSRETFDEKLGAILATDTWIIDGNYARTLPRRLDACDTVYFFDLPTEVCLAGAAARVGTVREEMPWVEETLDPAFAASIQTFRLTSRPSLLEWLREKQKDVHFSVVTFSSHEEAGAYLQTL